MSCKHMTVKIIFIYGRDGWGWLEIRTGYAFYTEITEQRFQLARLFLGTNMKCI